MTSLYLSPTSATYLSFIAPIVLRQESLATTSAEPRNSKESSSLTICKAIPSQDCDLERSFVKSGLAYRHSINQTKKDSSIKQMTSWSYLYISFFRIVLLLCYCCCSIIFALLKLEAMLQTPRMMRGMLNICPMSIGKPASKAT